MSFCPSSFSQKYPFPFLTRSPLPGNSMPPLMWFSLKINIFFLSDQLCKTLLCIDELYTFWKFCSEEPFWSDWTASLSKSAYSFCIKMLPKNLSILSYTWVAVCPGEPLWSDWPASVCKLRFTCRPKAKIAHRYCPDPTASQHCQGDVDCALWIKSLIGSKATIKLLKLYWKRLK